MFPTVQIVQDQNKTELRGIELENPLSSLVGDPEEITTYYRKFKIRPPFGDWCHSFGNFARLFHSLHLYSKTQGSITNSIADVSFTSDIDVTGGGFAKKKVSQAEKDGFFDFLELAGLNSKGLPEFAKDIYKAWKPSGNCLVVLKMYDIAGVKDVKFDVHDIRSFAYLDNEKQFIVTNRWFDFEYWKENPPIVVDKFTSFEDIEFIDGVATVAFHFKNSGYNQFLYAYPDTVHGLYSLFSEFQQQDGIIKEAHNHNIGRLLLLFDAMSLKISKSEVKDFIRNMANAMNNAINMGGNYPTGVMPMAAPSTENMQVVKMDANTNHHFHGWLSADNKDSLFTVNRWSRLLTGAEQPKSGFGADMMISELKTWSYLRINNIQSDMSCFLMEVLKPVSDFLGYDITGKELIFKNPYRVLMEEEANEKKESDDNIPL